MGQISDTKREALAARVATSGKVFNQETIATFGPLYSDLHKLPAHPSQLHRSDIAYGPDPQRNLLDIHLPEGLAEGTGRANRPIVIFFHGGGLIGGAKTSAGSPFYSNIADFFARNGAVAINATYRLAPDIQWPEGSRDVAAATAWARENAQDLGGDPDRVILIGHSAGATHVANYIFRPELYPASGRGFAGAILMSGVYGIDAENTPANHLAYYGSEKSNYARQQMLNNVGACDFPLMMTIAEFDPLRFEAGAYRLLTECVKKGAPLPRFSQFLGHNHITPAFAIGTGDAQVEEPLLAFLQRLK